MTPEPSRPMLTGDPVTRGPKLNRTEHKILRYLRSLPLNALPSTVRDIRDGASISSTSVVDYNLKNLVAKGLIHRTPSVSRSIRLVERMEAS